MKTKDKQDMSIVANEENDKPILLKAIEILLANPADIRKKHLLFIKSSKNDILAVNQTRKLNH